ncbi:hypothetical protein F2Q68_00044788 [Brassica cretica]|uniref:Uncharacterized protein n=1 Tax=Brassica cretica TaxID=69181 RepID=A0A8S9LNK9_BRACR|nr:hypothetical protein F2Q68_00044788 [Brassica cretica]
MECRFGPPKREGGRELIVLRVGSRTGCLLERDIDKRFAASDSTRRELQFDILLVVWVLTVWENDLFEVLPELGFSWGLRVRGYRADNVL